MSELLPEGYFRNRSIFENLERKPNSIILTEKEFHSLVLSLVTESLSIAEEVNRVTGNIIFYIKRYIRRNKLDAPIVDGSFRLNIFNSIFTIMWRLYDFDNLKEKEKPKQVGAQVDFENEEIYLDIVKIWGEVDTISLSNSLQHEIEHIYQRYKRPDQTNFKIKDKTLYDKALELLKNKDETKREIGRAIYLMFNFEQDAFVNGLYAAMKENDGSYSFNDIWNSNDAKQHLDFLIDFNNKIRQNEYPYIQSVKESLSFLNRNIIWLQNHTDKAIKRFANKIAHVKHKIKTEKENENRIY